MPYTRSTRRQLRRHLITFSDVCKANRQVADEMDRLGLWHPRLDAVAVYHVPAALACYGWFRVKEHISIPAVTGAQLSDFFAGCHTRLTDILRHERAHALADRRSGLVRTRRFRETFGRPYASTAEIATYDPDEHLTPYAATNPCEDFAETFCFFLRHKGRLPLRLRDRPGIPWKWAFVTSLVGA